MRDNDARDQQSAKEPRDRLNRRISRCLVPPLAPGYLCAGEGQSFRQSRAGHGGYQARHSAASTSDFPPSIRRDRGVFPAKGFRSSCTGSTIIGTPTCCNRRWIRNAVSLCKIRFQPVSSSKMSCPATTSAFGYLFNNPLPSFSASTATSIPTAYALVEGSPSDFRSGNTGPGSPACAVPGPPPRGRP